MKTIMGFTALIAVAMLMSIGSAPSTVFGDEQAMSGRPMAACELRFESMDTGSKGYLSERDLREAYYGPSLNDSRGRVESRFFTMDLDNDGRVSAMEYCRWRAPSGFRPTRSR